jgi:hypothetical protein
MTSRSCVTHHENKALRNEFSQAFVALLDLVAFRHCDTRHNPALLKTSYLSVRL